MQFVAVIFILSISVLSVGQPLPEIRQPDVGGEVSFAYADEMKPAERAAIIKMLDANKLELQKMGKWDAPVQQVTSFQWPLKKSGALNDNGFYGISNYIDQNPAVPNLLQDYNCGTRTYDLSSGYNHQGTDIFTWPFGWTKMQYNQVEIVAAAPGTIIGKFDGNFDRNCSFCTSACNWNAIYVRHADGSVAWYGHMKSGSPTTKGIGATVVAGEYLGVVGSSGNSTGPHLHFEVWTNDTYTTLVDPWAGPCNALNGNTSWWAAQQPYYNSTLNALITQGASPVFAQCSEGELVNEKKRFNNGERLLMFGYYRDQQNGQTAQHTLRSPDNSVYSSWTQNFTENYTASYWGYYWDFPNNAPNGKWTYEVFYNGKTVSTNFMRNQSMVYTFTGNGSFFNPSNWAGNQVPPLPVPDGVEVTIQTTGTNVCLVDIATTFMKGSKLTIAPNSRIRSQQNILIR